MRLPFTSVRQQATGQAVGERSSGSDLDLQQTPNAEHTPSRSIASTADRRPNQLCDSTIRFAVRIGGADRRLGSHYDVADRLDGAFYRRILAEREVCASPLVVRDVGPKDSTKMPLIEER
jgi:hypothetical protein